MDISAAATENAEPATPARTRAIIRFNAPLFHSLAAASFLETAVPLHAGRLEPALADRPDARAWLDQVWQPKRSGHGQRLRDYVEATWPELDWHAAYEEFCQAQRKYPATGAKCTSAALAVLGVCVAEVQAAIFYRALANGTDDPSLRNLAREVSSDHVDFFSFFRSIFEYAGRRENVGFGKSWRALQATCRTARDFHVRAAMEPLARHWYGPRTVPDLPYAEVVSRMTQLIQRHAALGRIEQLMFQAWIKPGRALTVALPHPARRTRSPQLERALV